MKGLTAEEARRRLDTAGPNALPHAPPTPVWRRFVAQFRSPLIYILLAALLLDAAVWVGEGGHGIPLEGVAIAVILLLNAGLGVWQERRAGDALAKLADLAVPMVRVYRDGELTEAPSTDIVPGDVVYLVSGDRVPADVTATRPRNLAVDESVLTGESVPVEKREGDELFAGTLPVRGTVEATVTRTGVESTLGRLATMLGTVEAGKTPLEVRLTAFGNRVARWVLVLAISVGIAGILAEGWSQATHVVLFAVALAVAVVPEGLPAILSVTLALGVERMAKRHAVVRRLSAVEALGSVTVIACDKTGTLTENRMVVRDVEAEDQGKAIHAMVLASDVESATGAGDPLEVALLQWVERQGHDPHALRTAHPRVAERAFDSSVMFMRATVRSPEGLVSWIKGAPEVLLQRCTMDDDARARWREAVAGYAADGYRVLALAWGEGEREDDLRWIGLVPLLDPPRPEVPEAMVSARAAGIRVLMITGDHPSTALTVARIAGMDADRVMTGEEFGALDAEGQARAVAEVPVFARVAPEDKLRIVELLKEQGEIVAVTGDGVNDAPALKRSDVGVAMGRRGSDVAREVADLILLDDNFVTIVAAIEEGRSIYANIQKFIRFLFSTNLSEVLVVTGGAAAAFTLGLRDSAGQLLLPLTAAQLLWINLVTDGAPALALGVDRNPGVMAHRPLPPDTPLLDRQSMRFIVATGTIKALIAGAILALLPWLLDTAPEVTRTATFLFLAAGQLLFAYPARHTGRVVPPNMVLHLAVAGGFAAQALVVYVRPVMRAFDAAPLPGPVGLWVAGSILASWGLAEVVARFTVRERNDR